MTTAQSLGPDEQFCPNCGKIVKKDSAFCPHCGVALKPRQGPVSSEGKSKAVAIVLAFSFGPWAWLYTYQRDGRKFWIAFVAGMVGAVATVGSLMSGVGACVGGFHAGCLTGVGAFVGFVFLAYAVNFAVWLWAFIDCVAKSNEWYVRYHDTSKT